MRVVLGVPNVPAGRAGDVDVNCPACGAPVWVGLEGAHALVLEAQGELGGPGRYIITEQRIDGHHVVAPVKDDYDQPAYRLHQLECPDEQRV